MSETPKSASKSLLKSTSIVSFMTLLSRVLGFVRDVLLARLFGAGVGMDAFFVAFKIPNFMRRLFAEGSFSQAFVPVFTEYKTNRSEQEVKVLADSVAGTLGFILLVLTIIGVLTTPWLIYVFAPGFSDEPAKQALAADMLRWTFPYLFFISLTAFAGGILNAYSRFAIPAFTPVLLNVVLISFAIWVAPELERPVVALAWGVFVAGLAQLAFQIPALKRLGMLPRPRWGAAHAGVRKIMRLMLPTLFGASVAQISLLLDTIIASFLQTGSVSWLYYSDRLMEFPLGIFGIAIATVILPSLSARHAEQSTQAFSATLDWGIRVVALIVVPSTVGLFVLAGPLLATLFQYGNFGANDTTMAHWSLMAYALGLIGFSMVKVLVSGFFSRQNTKTPVKIGLIAIAANMVLNCLIVVPMVMLDFVAPHMGLALATAGSATLNASLLYWRLRKDGVYQPGAGWGAFALRILLANSLMAVALLWLVADLSWWLQADALARVLQLAMLIAVAMVVYFAVLLISGMRLKDLRSRA